MANSFQAVVIGGGCLGCASAISIRRRLLQQPDSRGARVCLVEKHVIGSGTTARHSGIVRSANAVADASRLAKIATSLWQSLGQLWGVAATFDACGAIWIAKDDVQSGNAKWNGLERLMRETGVEFHQIGASEARAALPDSVNLHDGELYYLEPGALQFDPSAVRNLLYRGLDANEVDVRENTEVVGFERGDVGEIVAVLTRDGERLACDHVINAAGAWSPAIFSSLGLSIPVGVEPVYVANWLTTTRGLQTTFPIIADYVNSAYFRLWRGNELHMHQPRKRAVRETARAFAESPLAIIGADFINDPKNQGLDYTQIKAYERMARYRFNNIDQVVYGSGYRSFFDITPDLKFILGPDHRVPNLVHCLGAGQSFKYTPVFGEIMADFVAGGSDYAGLAADFPISRFDDRYMANFWDRVADADTPREAGAASL